MTGVIAYRSRIAPSRAACPTPEERAKHEKDHLDNRSNRIRNGDQCSGLGAAASANGFWVSKIFTEMPAGTTVTNFYKQTVYDPADNKIGDIDDVLIDKAGNVSALIVGVGGFLGMGEKHVAIPFSDVHASEKDNKWYLVLNTTKDALNTAPGFTYDRTRTTWIPAVK